MRPDPVTFDAQTALVVVDVQNDFVDPAGSLAVPGALDVLPVVNAAIASARSAGAFVVYTQDWHPEHTPHFAQDGGIWPVHCVAGTWGAQFHPSLLVAGPVVRKGTEGQDGFSGCTMRDPVSGETTPTELVSLLAERQITRMVVVGLATDYCVMATVLDGLGLGYPVDVVAGGIAAVELSPGDGQRAMERMRAAGARIIELGTPVT
jgi:nicotinamidase/pyrazinamidase